MAPLRHPLLLKLLVGVLAVSLTGCVLRRNSRDDDDDDDATAGDDDDDTGDDDDDSTPVGDDDDDDDSTPVGDDDDDSTPVGDDDDSTPIGDDDDSTPVTNRDPSGSYEVVSGWSIPLDPPDNGADLVIIQATVDFSGSSVDGFYSFIYLNSADTSSALAICQNSFSGSWDGSDIGDFTGDASTGVSTTGCEGFNPAIQGELNPLINAEWATSGSSPSRTSPPAGASTPT